MKRVLIALLVAGPVFAQDPAGSPPVELKGVQLRLTEAQLKAKFPNISCDETPARFRILSDRSCSYSSILKSTSFRIPPELETIAEYPVSRYHFGFYGDSLETIAASLPTGAFMTVVRGLEEKYGKPTKTDEEKVRSGGGAELINFTVTWVRGDQRIVVQKYWNDIRTMNIDIKSDRADAEYKARSAKGTKDL